MGQGLSRGHGQPKNKGHNAEYDILRLATGHVTVAVGHILALNECCLLALLHGRRFPFAWLHAAGDDFFGSSALLLQVWKRETW